MNPFFLACKQAFRRPAFVVMVVLLGACAATLNTAASHLQIHFKKLPVPMRVNSLKEGIPQTLGHWVMVSTDQPIDAEVQQVLATSHYVFRDYVDDRKVTATQIEDLKAAGAAQRDLALSRLQTERPSAVIRAAVTYYTGLVDTVAHVPERCYVADGFEVKEREEYKATAGNYRAPRSDPSATPVPREVNYRFVSFEDQTGLGNGVRRVARNVGYLFHCNGHYTADPYKVRASLQNLFEPYGYYAKVELMTASIVRPELQHGVLESNSRDDSRAAMEDFFTEILPFVEDCLPDWNAVHAKAAAPEAAR